MAMIPDLRLGVSVLTYQEAGAAFDAIPPMALFTSSEWCRHRSPWISAMTFRIWYSSG
jgi:hypothetical protein